MILFLITFFIVFTLICAKNIRYGIYAIIFLMPLYLIRFSIFGIPSTVLEIMIYILFLVWILNKIKNVIARSKETKQLRILIQMKEYFVSALLKSSKKFSILNIGILLLFLGLAISIFNSIDLRTSLGIFKGWFFDPFLFFIVFVSVIKKDKQIILSLKSWIFSGIIISLVSIFYLLNNELTFDDRLRAFFLSPNHLAMYLSPVLLIVLFLLLYNKKLNIEKQSYFLKTISNIQYPVSIIIISIPLFFTYSHGAFLGIFIGISYLFIRSRRLKIKNVYLLGFILLLGLIFISSNKFDQITDSNNRSSFHSRLMIWNTATEIIKDNPIFGIGPGTFQETYLSYAERFDEPYLEWAVPQPHNIFLAFYIQTGLIGLMGFIIILVWFFRCNLKCKNSIFVILISLMLYTLVHGLVDTTYWKNDLALVFWLIIGITVVGKMNDNLSKKL